MLNSLKRGEKEKKISVEKSEKVAPWNACQWKA